MTNSLEFPHGAPCNRREFLRTATTAVAGAAVASPLVLCAAPPTEYQLGCYTRPWDKFEYRVALDGIAEAGFKYAGFMTAKGKSWVMITVESTPEEVLAMAREARARNLKILSIYGGDFPVSKSVEAGIQGLRTLIDHCASCECPNLLLGGTTDVSLAAAYYKTVAECASYAADKRVGLAIKPHGGTNATGPQCRRIIEEVNRPSFRLWYDPGNIFYYSDGALDPVADSAEVNGIVSGVSIKDFVPPKEVLVTPGTGKVRFNQVFANLRKGGFRSGPVLVECVAVQPEASQITAQARQARIFSESLLKEFSI